MRCLIALSGSCPSFMILFVPVVKIILPQTGTAHIRRKITKGRAYTECFVDDLNDFYRTGFRVHDAHRVEDFTLRLKLYCTVCDFPGR